MGSKIGHTAPGLGFFMIGLWHLYNHTKQFVKQGTTKYHSFPWFPCSCLRYLELYIIIFGTLLSVSMELFITPIHHQPLDPDGTIPSNHLHNFEHSLISLNFLVFAIFALILDKILPNAQAHELLHLVGSTAFAQELLLFHLHSTDHMGLEGHYHWLLQLVIFVSMCTTLLGIGNQRNFFISYIRSLSILFQGIWMFVMGYMLWTPSFIPKGCLRNVEDGRKTVRCDGDESLMRAKGLTNILFSWLLIVLVIFAVSFYVGMMRFHGAYKDEDEYMVVDDLEEAKHVGDLD